MKNIFKLIIEDFHGKTFPLKSFDREIRFPDNPHKIIVAYGPRRSGKTFCFYNHINHLLKSGIKKENILYINFEDERLFNIKVSNLNDLIEGYYEIYPQNTDSMVYLFLDEIQFIKNWELFVRRVYDTQNFKIFITGSSAKLLSKEIATSLRGRCLSYPIYLLSFAEYLNFKGIKLEENFRLKKSRFKIVKAFNIYIRSGAFPEIALSSDEDENEKTLKEYYDSLVYRDLLDRFSLKNSILLRELLQFLLTNITKEFSINSYYKSLQSHSNVSRDTLTGYINCILETSYFYFLPIFSYSLKKQTLTPKKIITIDNGLRNRICFRTSEDFGKLAENLVGMRLISLYEEVFYWKDKFEVDFVVKDSKGFLHAYNVSYGDNIPDREYKSLLEFKNLHRNVKTLTILTNEFESKQQGINITPLLKWINN